MVAVEIWPCVAHLSPGADFVKEAKKNESVYKYYVIHSQALSSTNGRTRIRIPLHEQTVATTAKR
jgi:hypothetical protein